MGVHIFHASVLGYGCCAPIFSMVAQISKRQICGPVYLSHSLPSPYNICFTLVNADLSQERNGRLTSVWITKRGLLEAACYLSFNLQKKAKGGGRRSYVPKFKNLLLIFFQEDTA
jgi:hypothetical protein